ncbi:hypothetical protein chiPu_0004647 [Chiloscyllium punctatum]|uniref:Uncharacterized protein n=1 Tax=Chiloscyllium punctatum TaxID=137246 RepID=A0A401S762_CHIPU|nr:hypothetical protein [Chiloscyllium punctatum]
MENRAKEQEGELLLLMLWALAGKTEQSCVVGRSSHCGLGGPAERSRGPVLIRDKPGAQRPDETSDAKQLQGLQNEGRFLGDGQKEKPCCWAPE